MMKYVCWKVDEENEDDEDDVDEEDNGDGDDVDTGYSKDYI